MNHSISVRYGYPIGYWCTKYVYGFDGIFNGLGSFNEPLTHWSTENAGQMNFMFYGIKDFDQDLVRTNLKPSTAPCSLNTCSYIIIASFPQQRRGISTCLMFGISTICLKAAKHSRVRLVCCAGVSCEPFPRSSHITSTIQLSIAMFTASSIRQRAAALGCILRREVLPNVCQRKSSPLRARGTRVLSVGSHHSRSGQSFQGRHQ